MSISSLLSPNSYILYCQELITNNIILPGDTNGIVEVPCALYTGTTAPYTFQRNVTLNYSVHKNGLFMWLRSSTGNWVTNIPGSVDNMFLGPWDPTGGTNPGDTGTPLDFNIPYVISSADGDLCYVVNVQFPNPTFCRMQINSNKNGIPGSYQISFQLGSPDGGTTKKQWTSGVTANFCNFFVAMGVTPVTTP